MGRPSGRPRCGDRHPRGGGRNARHLRRLARAVERQAAVRRDCGDLPGPLGRGHAAERLVRPSLPGCRARAIPARVQRVDLDPRAHRLHVLRASSRLLAWPGADHDPAGRAADAARSLGSSQGVAQSIRRWRRDPPHRRGRTEQGGGAASHLHRSKYAHRLLGGGRRRNRCTCRRRAQSMSTRSSTR